MRRIAILAALAFSALASVSTASGAGTLVPTGNASCAGFLAAAANPNAGSVLHELVKPSVEAQGMTLGEFQRIKAQEHPGSGGFPGLLACIPEF